MRAPCRGLLVLVLVWASPPVAHATVVGDACVDETSAFHRALGLATSAAHGLFVDADETVALSLTGLGRCVRLDVLADEPMELVAELYTDEGVLVARDDVRRPTPSMAVCDAGALLHVVLRAVTGQGLATLVVSSGEDYTPSDAHAPCAFGTPGETREPVALPRTAPSEVSTREDVAIERAPETLARISRLLASMRAALPDEVYGERIARFTALDADARRRGFEARLVEVAALGTGSLARAFDLEPGRCALAVAFSTRRAPLVLSLTDTAGRLHARDASSGPLRHAWHCATGEEHVFAWIRGFEERRAELVYVIYVERGSP